MKVLVTGGTGVIGTAAIPALLEAGHQVRLLSRHAEGDAQSFPKGVEPFAADVSDPARLNAATAGCDAVLHIAGIVEEEPPEITFEKVNVDGTRHLLDAARETGSPNFIFISSLGAERGSSDYQRSKFSAEQLVRDYPGRWLILRPGNVFGPGDEAISMLLKMLRTLPAVPVVARGEQPFQPLWFADFGQVLAQAVSRSDLAGQALDLAGPDVTTTEDVLRRLEAITGCKRPRLQVPIWITEVGVQALEAFGGAGRKLLRSAGVGMPLKAATFTMLLEGSVIPDSEKNALLDTFEVTPTSLDDGLQMLAEILPEQLPGDGVGALHEATYSAEIRGSPHLAPSLLDLVCEHICDVMPIEFAAEPGAPEKAESGSTLTARIPGRGNMQVRLDERTPTRATFVTIEGHPLAGVMQLHTEDIPGGVRFNVHVVSQPANAFDWLAMRTIGASMQASNWRAVVRRVVELSGGEAPDGVRHTTHALDDAEAREVRCHVERIVQKDHRERAVCSPTTGHA